MSQFVSDANSLVDDTSWLVGVIESACNLDPSHNTHEVKLCDIRYSKSASDSVRLDSRRSNIFFSAILERSVELGDTSHVVQHHKTRRVSVQNETIHEYRCLLP